MPEATARFAAMLLAAVFVWAAASKLFSFTRWNVTLDGYGLPRVVRSIAAPVVPMIELATAALLLFASRAGAAAALAILGMFCLAILHARDVSGDYLPCGCFGGSEQRGYRSMLWRNAVLGGLAAIVLFAEGRIDPVVPGAPGGQEWLAVVLVVVGASLALWTALRVTSALRDTTAFRETTVVRDKEHG